MMRVFHDRLTNEADRKWFKETIAKSTCAAFKIEKDYDEWFVHQTIIFGDFMRIGETEEENINYEEVGDMGKLKRTMEEYLDNYNIENPK